MYQIDKGIELPAMRVRQARRDWPFDQLMVGDSFLVSDAQFAQVCNAHRWASKKLGRKFTARRVEGGIRVWRVA